MNSIASDVFRHLLNLHKNTLPLALNVFPIILYNIALLVIVHSFLLQCLNDASRM